MELSSLHLMWVGVMEYCLAEIFVEVQVDKAAVSTRTVCKGRLYFGRHFSRRRSSEIRRQEYPAKLLISRRTCQFGDQLQFGEWEYADSRVSITRPAWLMRSSLIIYLLIIDAVCDLPRSLRVWCNNCHIWCVSATSTRALRSKATGIDACIPSSID